MDSELRAHIESEERKDDVRVPSWRLREEAEKRRKAEKRVSELEFRVKELELALKSRREEFVFRRKPVSQRVSPER
jgi:hypothetical protein